MATATEKLSLQKSHVESICPTINTKDIEKISTEALSKLNFIFWRQKFYITSMLLKDEMGLLHKEMNFICDRLNHIMYRKRIVNWHTIQDVIRVKTGSNAIHENIEVTSFIDGSFEESAASIKIEEESLEDLYKEIWKLFRVSKRL